MVRQNHNQNGDGEKMKKILKKYGDSLVVTFTKDERAIFKLKEGDVIEVEIDKPIDWKAVARRVKKDGKNE